MREWLPVIALLLPLTGALACASPHVSRNVMPRLLGLVPLPAFFAAVFAYGQPSFRIGTFGFSMDAPGAMLLGSAAVLWSAAGFFALASLGSGPSFGRFQVFWLLTMTGSFGVFLASDLLSFLTMFALASLPAYGLVVQDGTPAAQLAGKVYLAFALVGESLLLLGFALLASSSPAGSLVITEAVGALAGSPLRDLTLACLIGGFAMKLGLVPAHFWLPLAHPAAPAAGSAVLSGVIIKSGVIGLIRFLPMETPLADWGLGLAVAGLVTAIYGVVIGMTQSNPKTILAYSSVSQMGVIASLLGMGLVAGDPSVGWDAAFYAMHHLFAKGALFLAVGVVAAGNGRPQWAVMVPATLIGLGMAGLPFTGGALAKIAAKNVFGSGLAATFAAVSAAGTALLMIHFLRQLFRCSVAAAPARFRGRILIPFLALAVTGFVVRWAVYLAAGLGDFAKPFSPGTFWDSLWPVLAGGVAAALLWAFRWPSIPPGDVGTWLLRLCARCGDATGRPADRAPVNWWPLAVTALLVVMILLALLLAMPSGNF